MPLLEFAPRVNKKWEACGCPVRISVFIASEYCPLLARGCLLLELCEMSLLVREVKLGIDTRIL